jgi:hypothetical protein
MNTGPEQAAGGAFDARKFMPKGVLAMRFQPGQSGNPAGRPPGALNKKTLEVEAQLAQRAEASVAKIIDRADNGEPAAMRLVMDRVAPTGTSRPLPFELPPVETPDDVAAAARAVLKAMAEGAIAPRETVNLLAVVAAAARIAERVQSMKERHETWWGDGLRDTARAALASVLKEDGIDAFLYSPVNSDAADAKAKHSPVEATKNRAAAKASDRAAAAVTGAQKKGEGLYSPVNSKTSVAKAAPRSATSIPAVMPDILPAPDGGPAILDSVVLDQVDELRAQASGGILRKRRHKPLTSVAPNAVRFGGGLPVNRRSYVADQKWLASMLENGLDGATKRKAA